MGLFPMHLQAVVGSLSRDAEGGNSRALRPGGGAIESNNQPAGAVLAGIEIES
jgi:hypothetical protein